MRGGERREKCVCLREMKRNRRREGKMRVRVGECMREERQRGRDGKVCVFERERERERIMRVRVGKGGIGRERNEINPSK